jgi:hypothetical protein
LSPPLSLLSLPPPFLFLSYPSSLSYLLSPSLFKNQCKLCSDILLSSQSALSPVLPGSYHTARPGLGGYSGLGVRLRLAHVILHTPLNQPACQLVPPGCAGALMLSLCLCLCLLVPMPVPVSLLPHFTAVCRCCCCCRCRSY